ncbi:MAG: hypothetical protein JO126_00395 [Alphaproteobacteria bacterium]|nr:hypothetical protein [Alphaproteobacteria bacterium]MBV8547900.1 hypothetical protein [Alphaproteobacteria bacterium]
MALPHKLFIHSFRKRRLGWFFAALVLMMVYLATFVTAAEVTLSAVTLSWDSGVQSRLTVEIPAIEDESATPQTERAQQALAILHAMPSVAHVSMVSEQETLGLIKPWINQPDLLKALPVPILIDIERKAGATLTAEDVRQALKSALHDVRVDDHANWLSDLGSFVNGLTLLGLFLILLTALTLMICITLLCRSVMATERATIDLLHFLGADDRDIAAHFQRLTISLSWLPALTGFGGAVVSAMGLLYYIRNFADTALLSTSHWAYIGATVLAVPLTAVVIASYAARLSVLSTLRSAP